MTHLDCRCFLCVLSVATLVCASPAAMAQQTGVPTGVLADASADSSEANHGSISYLVPELKGAGLRVSSGKRQFKNRFTFSPGIGQLGNRDFFAFRLAFNPNAWMGYEVSFGHNPASALHGLLHTFNVLLRYPMPWRIQPYATIGYGMMTIFPGQALNADPVTKNTLTAGGGLEIYIRNDVALRGEMRGATVFGQELGNENTVAYTYREYTVGFAFYRNFGR